MKVNYFFKCLALLVFTLCSVVVQSQNSGIFDAYVITESNGEGNFYHHLLDTNGFNGSHLGDFTCGNSLILKGAQVKTYKCPPDDIFNGMLSFRIYLTSGAEPGFTDVNLPFSGEVNIACGGKDQIWEENNASIDILAGLPQGNYTLEVFARSDYNGGTHFWSNFGVNFKATFMVYDENPTITCPGDITVGNDAGSCGAVVSYGTPIGTDYCPGASTTQTEGLASGSTFPIGTTTNTFEVTDAAGNAVTCSFDVTVTNVIPTIDSWTLIGDPIDINLGYSVSATFTDTNLTSATWDWGDGSSSNGNISGNTITDYHTYSEPGVYRVELTIMDACGLTDSEAFEYIVIYDPNGGFVTGGGWINSPEGAYVADPSLTGKATFGFVSKYQKGRSIPQGNTEFQFHAANINFKSTVYEWLVVAGNKAMFKGSGTINGMGDYQFILAATDDIPNAFRIKIKENGGGLVYDNQMGLGDNEYPSYAIAGGSIIVHEGGKGKNSSARGTESKSEMEDVQITEELVNGFKLASWPNPSKDEFHLKLNSGNRIDKVEIFVYDINGRQVYHNSGKVDQEYHFGKTLGSGIYFVNVVQADRSLQLKMIKY